jgi:ABC-2 type transport system permease protein
MPLLGPYLKSFQLALQTQFTHRVNFLIGRVREFVVYGAILLLYLALPQGSGNYSQQELLTYALMSSLLGSTAFVYSMHKISDEIVEGDLTNYLLRPIHYFGYWTSRLLAERALVFLGGILQTGLLIWLFSSASFFVQKNPIILLQTSILYIGSLVLIQLFDFIGGTFSFWTNRGHGPRWLITIFIQFLSGSYLPLEALPGGIKTILSWTPFPSILFAPLQTYLGHTSTSLWITHVLTQWLWIGILFLLLRFLWQRGIKTYSAYGR